MHLVPHFHVDPVWWNTQAASIDQLARSDWSASPRMAFQRSALDVLRQHLDHAERNAEYRFCIAEVDYLEPFWYHFPHERHRVERLVAQQRIDVVGATYNEPSTNLTSLELTRRNLQLGLAFQRDVLGASADISWQLDVFGHDPSLPSVLHDAGVTATVFARGPYGPWGPLLEGGFDSLRPTTHRPVASEFEWIAPDGRSVLAVYLVGHYSSGYELDRRETLDDARRFMDTLDQTLGPLASTDHVFVPIGTDLGPPSRWVTDLTRHDDGPAVVVSTPTMAIGAIRSAARRAGAVFAPLSRDMNPIYTGKDVSYIDSKQAHRAVEQLLVEAEVWATLAHVSCGFPYPHAPLDDAWRLLIYGSHHDALTGTESDQVYIDLTAGWRHAHDLASTQRSRAMQALAATTDTRTPDDGSAIALVVHSATFGRRRDIVRVDLGPSELAPLATPGLRVVGSDGADLAFVVDHHAYDPAGNLAQASLSILTDTADIGRHVLHVRAGGLLPQWTPIDGHRITNGNQELTVDPLQGGCVTSWIASDGVESVHPGRLANELVWYPEYPQHPDHGEGPWHLSPTGTSSGSGSRPAQVQAERSPVGERLRIQGALHHDGARRVEYASELTLWSGVERLDATVQTDAAVGSDHLLRVRWPVGVPGATPVVETAEAVIGRGPAFVDVDAAEHPWTLDTPAHGWFGTSVTCRVDVRRGTEVTPVAVGIAEIVVDERDALAIARPLVVALAASGVTATVTLRDADRAGRLGLDSNVPDVRFVLGQTNEAVIVEHLARLGGADRRNVDIHLDGRGRARGWIPAARPRADVLRPSMDVRDPSDLSTLLILGASRADLELAVADIVAELADSVITVDSADPAPRWAAAEAPLDRTVALLNRGTPGSAVTADGCLMVSLVRASTGWPSGVWIDPPRRTVPDGSAFQLQHWSHRFEYAVVGRSGDWRTASIGRAAMHYRHPLHATVEPCHVGDLSGGVADLRPNVEGIELRAVMAPPRPASRPGPTLVVRVSESRGRPTQATISASFAFRSADRVDLRGRTLGDASPLLGDGSVTLDLTPFEAATVELEVDAPAQVVASETIDDHPPSFSRWWVQGRGPRTSRVGPVAVHLHPPGAGPADPWVVTVARVPGCLEPEDEAGVLAVALTLDGHGVEIPVGVDTVLELDAGGFAVVPLSGRVSGGPGHRVVRVWARWQTRSGRVGTCIDETVVSLDATTPVIEFLGRAPEIRLGRGDSTDATWTLVNHTADVLFAEVDIVSPWGTWDLIPVARSALTLAPGSATDLVSAVEAPLRHPAGQWWWMARAVAGPNVAYSPTSTLAVDGPPLP